jgi:hypothetical protein
MALSYGVSFVQARNWPRKHAEDTNVVSKYSVILRVLPWLFIGVEA